jgi:hypothetical protein
MNTTEIFVEQMIIGGLIMLTGYILFPVEIHGWLLRFQSPFAQISIGAVLTGFAYLIGTVYDRFTDTIFQDLEKHCRLSYALKGIKSESELETDPYPETIYRMAVVGSDSAVQREDYFRRRIRLTRAFATLIPAISAAMILTSSTCYNGEPWYMVKAAAIPLSYLIAFLYKNIDTDFLKYIRPPRTDNEKLLKRYWRKQFRKKDNEEKHWKLLRSIFADFACWILLLTILILGIIQIIQSGNDMQIVIFMFTGIVTAGVVTWSWWRIYLTYFAFVKNYYVSINGEEIKMKSSTSLSAEIRWFIEGKIPEDVKKWFYASRLKEKEEEERTDTYLIYLRAKSCGVKFRNSKFEIKTLVEDLGFRKYGSNVEGKAGIWEKLSIKGELVKTFKQKVTEGEVKWVEVKKQRVIRKYSIDKAKVEEVNAILKHPPNGCNVELTKIEINEVPHWTFAFDSFSEEYALLKDNLTRTINKLLTETDCPFIDKGPDSNNILSGEKSQSYPDFLS